MQQGVEAPFISRGAVAEDNAGSPGNSAGGVHLAGVGKFLQRIKEQQGDLGRNAGFGRGMVKSGSDKFSRHCPNPRYSFATALILSGVQGGS